jgi:hypothetical protein
MVEERITCPQCGHKFVLSEILQQEFGEQLKAEIEVQTRKEVEDQVRSEEREKYDRQLKAQALELNRTQRILERAQRSGKSGELMGEVAEQILEDRLRTAFPEDKVQPIARGKQGADVIQTIRGGGSLLWESKDHCSTWSNSWIPKLKRDRDAGGASVALLVTTVGPGSKPLKVPTLEDGVVMTPPLAAVGVAALLRPSIIEIARQRRLYGKPESLQAAVYAWVTSQEFQRGVLTVLENLQRLQGQLSSAKHSYALWFKRMEGNVDQSIRSLGDFYVSAQGCAKLPDLPMLALPSSEPALPENRGTKDSEGE